MSAEYLPSALNVHVYWESRNVKDNSEWKLDVSVFQEITTQMGQTNSGSVCIQTLPPTSSIHCMETRPGSIAADVFQHPWDREYSFAFSPFSLISRVLRKILQENIDHLILVTLIWQTRTRYAQLLKMSV